MNIRIGTPTPTHKLIDRLRLMADAGGMLSRDRIRTIIEAADRLVDLDEQVQSLTDQHQHGGDED